MERIFWVTCPECEKKFYADYTLRQLEVALLCPFCERSFKVEESTEIDERPTF